MLLKELPESNLSEWSLQCRHRQTRTQELRQCHQIRQNQRRRKHRQIQKIQQQNRKIRQNGLLTVEGTDDYEPEIIDDDDYSRPIKTAPWCEYYGIITSAKVNVQGITSMEGMFFNCYRLKSIDFSGSDTSKVTDISYMFYEADYLSEIDLSACDFGNVTNVECFIQYARDIKKICTPLHLNEDIELWYEYIWSKEGDASGKTYEFFPKNLDTSITLIAHDPEEGDSENPTVEETGKSRDITWTFYKNGLLTLEGSGNYELKESTDEDMSGIITDWAKYGDSITSVKMNVTGITSLDYLLDRCWAVKQIDFSGSDFSKVTSAKNIFDNELYNKDTNLFLIKCPKGVSMDIPLPKGKGFGWYNETDRREPFYTSFPKNSTKAITLRKADVKEFPDDENLFVEGKSGDLSWNINRNGKLTITGKGDYELIDMEVYNSSVGNYTEKDVPEWMRYASSIQSATIGVNGITSTKNMFKNCTNLKSINLSGLDTSKVTDMSGMFCDSSSLEELDLSGFDTSKVTNVGRMFGYCTSLKKLNMSGCNFGNLDFDENWDMSDMDTFNLQSCTSLEEVKCPLNLKITSQYAPEQQYVLPKIEGKVWVDSSNKMYTSMPENLKESITLTAIDGEEFVLHEGDSGNAHWELRGNGKLIITGEGDFGNYVPWSYYNSQILSVQADIKGITSTASWFSNCSNLKEVDFTGIDTSKVTDMSSMFYFCNRIQSLDLSSLDTSSVTDMSSMFYYCKELEKLNVSQFDTREVTNMSSMFSNCRKLPVLNISNFSTDKVTDMSSMFECCMELESLDVSQINTSKVTNMSSMFGQCDNIITLDLSNFNTSNVENMENMFDACDKLRSLNVSNFNAGKVSNMDWMFESCSKLEYLDMSSFVFPDNAAEEYIFADDYDYRYLKEIKCPINVTIANIKLPQSEMKDKATSIIYETFPTNLTDSIILIPVENV